MIWRWVCHGTVISLLLHHHHLLLGRTYLAPICPRRVFMEKAMSMRVTSGGSTAAPAPFLIASSYLCVNGRVFDRRSCEGIFYLLRGG